MKNLIVILFLFLAFMGCQNDFLERPPLDAIDEEFYWSTAQDLENYVIQFYPDFPTHGMWQFGYGYPITNGDDAILGVPNPVMNGERGITTGTWAGDWSRIRSVNIFFDNYTKVNDVIENYRQYVGEAHFFRAWYYFQLVEKYGDVPWYGEQILPNEEDKLLRPRDSRTVVIDSIISDLDRAKEYLHLKSEVGNLRINKETALAFKTRVALYEGTWQKYHSNTNFGTSGADPNKYFEECILAATELISGDEYLADLFPNYRELFGLDDMTGVDEVFLYRAYSIADGFSNDVNYTILQPGELGVTWAMVSSYLDKSGKPFNYIAQSKNHKGNDFLGTIAEQVDPRFSANVWIPGDLQVATTDNYFDKPQIDGNGLSLNTTGFQIKKATNPNSFGAGGEGGGNSETGYILFRYGEVLLNYAEALYESTGTVAYEELNLLRSRAGMPDFSINLQHSDPEWSDYGYPISDELYEIRRERRAELALEGFRSNDYKRWAAHNLFQGKRPKGYPFKQSEFPDFQPELDENGLIDYFQNALPNGYQFREDQDYLSPIPVEELTLNPNLEQNPGW